MNLSDLAKEVNLLLAQYASDRAAQWHEQAHEAARPVPEYHAQPEEETQPGPWEAILGDGEIKETNLRLPKGHWSRWDEKVWDSAHLVHTVYHGRYFVRHHHEPTLSVTVYYATNEAELAGVCHMAVEPGQTLWAAEQEALKVMEKDYAARLAEQGDSPFWEGLGGAFWEWLKVAP